TIMVQAPVAGTILTSTATIGAFAAGRGEALVSISARNEYDLVGLVPSAQINRLAVNQTARIRIVGAGEVDGKIRRIAPTVEPNSQLGQAFIAITGNARLLVNAFGRAVIKTGQSCGVALPLTAILYDPDGTVVQVVRNQRVETKRVEIGLMAGGQVEIRDGLNEGDVARRAAGRSAKVGSRCGVRGGLPLAAGGGGGERRRPSKSHGFAATREERQPAQITKIVGEPPRLSCRRWRHRR
ncbi:efflux RND transporter periplasmic adaptor subunit, partial [Bradyrhizobium sp.]|uniref:efflux RND transporter periplasmic adaptor subunit n=1 Tax=Bradyrhizobium sp. TaxID=376 RepID=UPI00391CB4E0